MEEIKPNYTRVTTPLQVWNKLDNIDPDVLQKACDRGTLVHKYCEMYATGEYFPEPEKEVSLFLDSYRLWFDRMVEEVLFTEERFYDDKLMLTGCIDLAVILKGDKDVTVIDIKTPQTASKTWPLQLAAYAYGWSDVKRRIALQLRKDGKRAKVIEYTNHERDWELYRNALQIWRFFQ